MSKGGGVWGEGGEGVWREDDPWMCARRGDLREQWFLSCLLSLLSHFLAHHSGVSKSPMNSISLDKTSLGEGGVDFSPIPPRSISPQTLPSLVESNPSLTNQWMEFNTEEGKYYHNFYSGNTTATLTPAMNVIQAPVAMKKNQNMLRAKSDFMPRLLRFRSWWQETKSFEGGIERNEIEVRWGGDRRQGATST